MQKPSQEARVQAERLVILALCNAHSSQFSALRTQLTSGELIGSPGCALVNGNFAVDFRELHSVVLVVQCIVPDS